MNVHENKGRPAEKKIPTVVTEVLEVAEDLSYIKFKTRNSIYELFKL
jgi:hypothetical protein